MLKARKLYVGLILILSAVIFILFTIVFPPRIICPVADTLSLRVSNNFLLSDELLNGSQQFFFIDRF